MVLLSSSAFDDSRLLPYVLSTLGKSVDALRACIVVSASPLGARGPNAIKTMDYLSNSQVAQAEFVDLREGAAAKRSVHDSDLILLNGGNPFTLLSVLQRQNFLNELKALASSERIVVGISAGAMMFSPGLHLVQDFNQIMGFDDKGNEDGVDDLRCLDLFDEYVFPHFDAFSQRVPDLAARLDSLSHSRDATIYRQNNGQTAIVRQRRIEDIGSNDQRLDLRRG